MSSKSTIERGAEFRELVASMLAAAGFAPATEIRIDFKKVDIVWSRQDIDGTQRYLVEAKDYAGSLPRSECSEFRSEYGALVDAGHAERAWLVSRGDIVTDGRALVDSHCRLTALTFAEFQRRLFGLDAYLHGIVAAYEHEGIGEWYVRPHTIDGLDLEERVRAWLTVPEALPLAMVAGYGKGKSTFARHLAAGLAREALADQSRRVPVLVPLGDIVDEQSLEGLFGKVFAAGPGARGYNFGLFTRLNEAGRFVVIFDGFDEMKHGMTLPRFEANIVELMRLDRGSAKLMVLGRDTAFQDDLEFRSLILGRQRTAGGSEVGVRGRRAFAQIDVRDFQLSEAREFVGRYLPVAAREALRGVADGQAPPWLQDRAAELLNGKFDRLLSRPVHAQMLCQIATDQALALSDLSTHGLFDRFVHFLIDREVRKRGRDPRFGLEARRRFNAALALWLWRQGRISTVSLASVPMFICRSAAEGISHDFDEYALRKELMAGCLVEKGGGTIFFGHRSLQEFLVAEALLTQHGPEGDLGVLLGVLNPEVATFIVDACVDCRCFADTAAVWLASLTGLRRLAVPLAALRMFLALTVRGAVSLPPPERDPWYMWLHYFHANGGIGFAPTSRSAANMLLYLVQVSSRWSTEARAAAMILAAKVLSGPSDVRRALGVSWLAAVLRPPTLLDVVDRASKCRRDEFAYVVRSKEPELWTLLYAARFTRADGDLQIVIDLYDVARRLSPLVKMGISEDEADEGDDADEVGPLHVSVQSLYRTWGLREAELERLRPFFNDGALRAKVRPLEVDKVQRRPQQSASETAASPDDSAGS